MNNKTTLYYFFQTSNLFEKLSTSSRSQPPKIIITTTAGIPLCNLRTISEQVKLEEVVGTGKYGEVWKGVWLGGFVLFYLYH